MKGGGRRTEGAEPVTASVSAALRNPNLFNHKVLRATLKPTLHQRVTANMTPVNRACDQKASSRRGDEIRAACRTCHVASNKCPTVAWGKVSCDSSTRFPPLRVSGRQKSERQ